MLQLDLLHADGFINMNEYPEVSVFFNGLNLPYKEPKFQEVRSYHVSSPAELSPSNVSELNFLLDNYFQLLQVMQKVMRRVWFTEPFPQTLMPMLLLVALPFLILQC